MIREVTGISTPPTSAVISEESVLAKCRYFVDVQLWQRQNRLDPSGWLSNFTGDEKVFGLHLLNSFIFYSREVTERLFVGGFHRLSQRVIGSKKSFLSARGEWRRFVNSAIVVRVTGERPSDSDGGYIFSRLARDRIGVPEANVVSPEVALQRLISDTTAPVVFVDDFVGSGQQFETLWERFYSVGKHPQLSFRMVAAAIRSRAFYYCPVCCTSKGAETLSISCPQVLVAPAHLIDARYSALHPESVLWPDELRNAAPQVIESVSRRVGIPDNGGGVGDWREFHKLGLSIAFDHGVPDATLPLFTWSRNGWRPLVRPS